MVFKIAVFIKQVPDTTDIRWTEHNTIQREGLDSVINPFDLGAIQLAKNVKFLNKETEITAVTMGPPQAEAALKQAIAMGCDRGILLSDKKFTGADTLATAYTLSQFIKTCMPDVDLIICGQQAVDGDTAQTPTSMAEKLSLQQITNVIALKEFHPDYAVWIKDTCSYKQEIKAPFPCLVAANIKDLNILPDINGYIKSQNTEINVLCSDDINADIQCIGLKGSPTQVKNAYRPFIERNTQLIENESVQNYAEFIINEINKCKADND